VLAWHVFGCDGNGADQGCHEDVRPPERVAWKYDVRIYGGYGDGAIYGVYFRRIEVGTSRRKARIQFL